MVARHLGAMLGWCPHGGARRHQRLEVKVNVKVAVTILLAACSRSRSSGKSCQTNKCQAREPRG